MSRVDELHKKYPSIPRHMIVRSEVATRGLRDTGELHELGEWVPLVTTSGSYASYDHDITLRACLRSRLFTLGRHNEGMAGG